MWVKMCGFTRRDDAVAAAELGADALGFVLARTSRKYADPGEVSKWISRIKGVEKVGVFYDEPAAEMMVVAVKLGLDTIQIHGSITEEHVPLLEKFRIIAAVRDADSLVYENKKDETGEVLMDLFGNTRGVKRNIPVRILIDPSMGWGVKADWKPYPFPFMLAGGLTPENVREAILKARPSGVDVSSGIEISPGIKDMNKMREFMVEAKS
jgi:phosphoribosylanthranilate isomerase